MTVQPRVNLRDYRFLELQLRWVERGPATAHADPKVHVLRGPMVGSSGQPWFTRLDVVLEPESSSSGYELRISIAGVVDVVPSDAEPLDVDKLAYLAALNGATILYGIIRAEVASLTANFPGGRLVLPTVYMHEVMEQQARDGGGGPPPAR